MFRIARDVAVHNGIPTETLFAGLPIREEDIGGNPWRGYPWDVYVEVLERLATAIGGYERLATAGELMADFAPEVTVLCSFLVSPKAVYRFVCLVLDPRVVPMLEIQIEDVGKDRLWISQTIADGYRGCLACQWGTLGAMRSIPKYIGLPPARGEALEITAKRAVYLVDLPPSQTLVARAGRKLSTSLARKILHDIGDEREELDLTYASLQAAIHELETRNTALSEEIDSRRRIEHALTQVLRTVPTAAFLVTSERIAGANEAGAHALVREGALLEEALRAAVASRDSSNGFDVTATATAGHFVVMRHGIGDEIERRIELAGRRWRLTARHRDVLRALVDGKSNAEIGLSLGCTPRTVETHITALLERADAPSRLSLVAAFWTDL